MYEAHFGLENRPFGETVSPSVYVSVPSRDAALAASCVMRLEHGQGPAVLFGPSGSEASRARTASGELGGPGDPCDLPDPLPRSRWWHLALELGGLAAPTLLSMRPSGKCETNWPSGGPRPAPRWWSSTTRGLNQSPLLKRCGCCSILQPRDRPTCPFSLSAAPEILLGETPPGCPTGWPRARTAPARWRKPRSSTYVLSRLAATGASILCSPGDPDTASPRPAMACRVALTD